MPVFDGDPRFALITVNYSTTRWLELMLLTLSEQDRLDLVRHIVIVDQDSRDGGRARLREIAAAVPQIHVSERRFGHSHAAGVRHGLRVLDAIDAHEPARERANLLLFIDTDVIFRRPDTLAALARPFVEHGVAAAGELRRHLFPYPEAQASFLTVRRDCYTRPDVVPWVNHGSPAYWLQRSLWRAGLTIADFRSNSGGYVLHRGRAGVAAAREHRPLSAYASAPNHEPHFMGVPGGAAIWARTEGRFAELFAPGSRAAALQVLATRFGEGARHAPASTRAPAQ